MESVKRWWRKLTGTQKAAVIGGILVLIIVANIAAPDRDTTTSVDRAAESKAVTAPPQPVETMPDVAGKTGVDGERIVEALNEGHENLESVTTRDEDGHATGTVRMQEPVGSVLIDWDQSTAPDTCLLADGQDTALIVRTEPAAGEPLTESALVTLFVDATNATPCPAGGGSSSGGDTDVYIDGDDDGRESRVCRRSSWC